MIPFIYEKLSHILNQLVRLVFKREAIVEVDTTVKNLKKTWLKNSDNHLEDQLVNAGVSTKKIIKFKYLPEKKTKLKKKKKQCKKMAISILK